jgi:hypothetical protein
MKVAAVRAVADWLAGNDGVNAKLALVQRDGADPQPSNVTVYDESRDHDTALGRIKDRSNRPSVQVSTATATSPLLDSAQQGVPIGDFEITIGIRIARHDDETAKGLAALAYTEDAVALSLRDFHKEENVASRTRAGVVLTYCKEINTALAVAPDTDDVVCSFVTAVYQARYVAP